MTRYLLTSAAALALMSGVAMAQFASSTTTTTQSTVAPLPPIAAPLPSASGTISSSETQKTVDQNGVVVERSKTYSNNGVSANSTSHVETNAPDGTKTETTHKEWSQAPTVSTTTTRKTVTTTDE